MTRIGAVLPEPGVVLPGQWAHVKHHDRQHLVVAFEPEVDQAEPVRFACGRRYWSRAIWHYAPEPHLARCKSCARSEAR